MATRRTLGAGKRGLGQERRGPDGGLDAARHERSRAFLHAAVRNQDARRERRLEPETSRVGLVEAQPFVLLAYWEAAPQALAAARRRLGDTGARIVLRFRDASPGGPEGQGSFDVCVGEPRGQHFLKLGRSYRTLRCELGVLAAGGGFSALARSNVAHLPRHEESRTSERQFRTLRRATGPDPDCPPAPDGGNPCARGISPAEAAVEPPRRHPPAFDLRLTAQGGPSPRSFPPAPLPIVPPPAPSGSGSARVQVQLSGGPGDQPSNGAASGMDAAPSAGSSATGTMEAPAPSPELPPGEKPFYASEVVQLWTQPPGRKPYADLGPAPRPADEGITAVGGGEAPSFKPEVVSTAPATTAHATSYGGASPAPQPPGDLLDLELHADVVIYGRTKPGTRVYVSGAQVPVKGDGTFEARFAMPPSSGKDRVP